jgi:glycosyltransferase involved in cell wall biosynthesis
VDNTAEVVLRIQDQDPRLRYLKLPANRGIGFARQAGLQHVSGGYIALADSDDLWLPGKLTAQIDVLETYPHIEILFGDYRNIDHVEGTEGSGFAQTQAGMSRLTVRPLADDLWLVEGGIETGILRSNFVHPPTMVLRAAVFDKVGGFNIDLSTPVDHEFCWRAAVLGAQYAYINRILVERHRYSSSVTARVVDRIGQMLNALALCRQTCASASRLDLLNHIRDAESVEYKRLIRHYAETGQRVGAWNAFAKSMGYGFSPRAFLLLVSALGGPWALSFGVKIKRFLRPLWSQRASTCD